jgi:Flp pilus assembly protein TadG
MTRDADRDRGGLTVALMLVVVIALGAASLIVDGGRALAARRHAANTAEAAARFAASTESPRHGFKANEASAAATAHARRSGVPEGDVSVTITTDPDGRPVVAVTITEHRDAVFMALGGVEQISVRATGVARFTYRD